MHALHLPSPRPPPPTATPRRTVTAAAAASTRRDVLLAAATGVTTPVDGRLTATPITLKPGAVTGQAAPACSVPVDDDTATPPLCRPATLPPAVTDFDTVVARVAAVIDDAGQQPGTLARYRAAMGAASAAPRAFYACLRSHPAQYLPDVYTPAVGAACQAWGRLLPRPRCLYLAAGGDADAAVAAWPPCAADADGSALAVVTDGERILGLGDLGAHGAGIPVGKCVLHAAAGGLPPSRLIPVLLDAGTNTVALRDDPLYVGSRTPRLRGAAFDAFVETALAALRRRWPRLVIHWEDLAAGDGERWLSRSAAAGPAFNDDSQATGAAALAAILGATRVRGVPPLPKQRFLLFGAGQAGTGTAAAIVAELVSRGVSPTDAAASIFLIDTRGLVYDGRSGPPLAPWKRAFARRDGVASLGGVDPVAPLAQIVAAIQPTAVIGSAAVGGAFNADVLTALAAGVRARHGDTARPIVLALSNPTASSECTAEDAASINAVFASGTKFPGPASQVNNALIFPGIGLALAATDARAGTDGPFLAAARALAGLTATADVQAGAVLPPLARLVDITRTVAAAVAVDVVARGAAGPGCVPGVATAGSAERVIKRLQYNPFLVDER